MIMEGQTKVTRLAVVAGETLHGAIGAIATDRLKRIQGCIADWVRG